MRPEHWLYTIPLRLRSLFHRDRTEQELDDEIRFHLDQQVAENIANGMMPKEARRAALRAMEGLELHKEECREMRRVNWIEDTLHDFRYALRMMRKSPGFTAVAIFTLALGIGANTAIFSMLDAVTIKTLPVENPKQLVVLGGDGDGTFGGNYSQTGSWKAFSYILYRQFRDHAQSFQGLCAFQSFVARVRITVSGDVAREATGKVVSGNYFSVLGVNALWGRTLNDDDDRTPNIAVISYRAWKRLFGGNPAIVGKPVYLNGLSVTVVGITPPEFYGETTEDDPADFWMPLTSQPLLLLEKSRLVVSDTHWLGVIGRLKPPVSIQQAQTELTIQLKQFLLAAEEGAPVSERLSRAVSEDHIELIPVGKGISKLRERFSDPLRILMVIASLVLLIACGNVGNLLLARAVSRRKEMCTRLAIGATRTRLIRQLLTESILLASFGGLLGLLIAMWATRLLPALFTRPLHYIPLNVRPDAWVFSFTLATTFLTGILFGVAPAFQSARVDIVTGLKKTSGTLSSGSPGRFRLTSLLITAQIALSMTILTGAGLFIRSLVNLQTQDFGFSRDHVLVVRLDPHLGGYKPVQLPELCRKLETSVSAIPGVSSASLSISGLLSGNIWGGDITVAGYVPPPGQEVEAEYNLVTPRYFETVGIPLLLGRAIGSRDTVDAPRVAVINETMAKNFFPNQKPLGGRFGMGSHPNKWIEVIGVVKDAKYNKLNGRTPNMAYMPLAQSASEFSTGDLEVRSVGEPNTVAGNVRRVITEIDKNLPILDVSTANDRAMRSLRQQKVITGLSGLFGLLALILVCLGLYGVMSYTVAQRTNEIGIRVALGAASPTIRWMIMSSGMRIAISGVVLGMAASFALTRLIRSQLFRVSPVDPITLFGVTVLLGVVTLAACYIPARRASRVDPMIALRNE